MSLTVAEIEQILEDFIEKQNSYYQNSPMGKKTSDIADYLKDIKDGIGSINQNTGPNGTFSQSNMNDLLSRVDHNRNANSNNSNNASSTILEGGGSSSNNSKARKEYENELKKSADNTRKSFKEMTDRFKDMIKVFGKSIESIVGKLDENNKLYGELNKSGLEWSNSATNMALDINRAGFTVKEFSKILEGSSGNLRALGGEGVLHFMSTIEKTNTQLGDFGLGVDEYYKQSMAQADLIRVSGNIQQLNNENIGNSFHDLMGKTIALSSAFGMSTQEFIDAQKKVQTNEVDRGLVRQVAQRTGVSEDEMRARYVELQSVSPKLAQSVFRRSLGGTDETYAQNREIVQGLADVLGLSQSQFRNGMSRAQHEAVRQGDIDAARMSALGLSYNRNSQYIESRSEINNGLGSRVDGTLSGQQYADHLNRLLNPDNLTRTSTGLPYARMQGMGSLESMTNTQIQSFSKSLTSMIGVMDNMYTKQYPAFAEKINDVTKSLGKMDSTISHFLDSHQDGLASTFTYAQAPSLLGGTLFGGIGAGIGGAGIEIGKSILKHRRNIRKGSRLRREGLSGYMERTGHAGEGTLLEDMEPVPRAGSTNTPTSPRSSRFNMGRFRGLGRIAGVASIGLSAYDLYNSESHINDLHNSGAITDDQASRMKWEDWGQHIGEIGGGFIGGGIGAGLGGIGGMGAASIPLGIVGALGGSYIGSKALGYVGKGIGWGGYELTHLMNNNDETQNNNTEQTPNNNNSPQNSHINTQNNNTNRDQVAILDQISTQLGQLIRVSQQMSRDIRDLE